MSKYCINNEYFCNKDAIIDKCRNIITRNKDKKSVNKKDLKFLIALFEFHPNKEEKLKDLKRVFVDMDVYGMNLCFWIENKKELICDISFYSCIKNIPFGDDKKINLKIPFGKYKGQSIYDINDKDYLEWMYNLKNLDRGTKIKIGQYLRFGFIPFNPIAYNAEKRKRNEQ